VPAGKLDVEPIVLEPPEELAAAHAPPVAFHAPILLLRKASSNPVKNEEGGQRKCLCGKARQEGGGVNFSHLHAQKQKTRLEGGLEVRR
jgi:hypothetical protein